MCVCGYSYAQHNPNFDDNRTVIAALFQWKFTDIAIECEQYLGPLYYGGVQVGTGCIITVFNTYLKSFSNSSGIAGQRKPANGR